MVKLLWTASYLVVIQAVHSYILLTANIEDLHNIGKRVVGSPIGEQLTNIVRRAYDAFNSQLSKSRVRAFDTDVVFSYQPDEPEQESRSQRSDHHPASKPPPSNEHIISSLGKSASVYLEKIKNIFEAA